MPFVPKTSFFFFFSFLFSFAITSDERSSKENGSGFLQLGKPDDVDVSLELKDWLFALEGADDMAESHVLCSNENVNREERCWHTSFQSLMVKARSNTKHLEIHAKQKYPIELVTVSIRFVFLSRTK